jgi:D-methionine transport system permease protein
VDLLRSIPFIILIVAVIPLTRLLVGTSVGTLAAIVPLTLGAAPFVARIVGNALDELPYGLLEAGKSMGATHRQIIFAILLPQARTALIKGMTLMLVTLVAYSAMAGAVGAGGLGEVAIDYGYQRFDTTVMVTTVIILVLLVQSIQSIGDWFARYYSH